MLFRRLVLLSMVVGLIAGAILTLSQQFQSTGIILQSEHYEAEDALVIGVQSPGNHLSRDEAGWAPENGFERLMFSLLANVFTALGYSAMLLALMAYYQLTSRRPLGIVKGAAWGVLGYLTFFVAPSLGLSPEIPGMQAASLGARQVWWGATIIATGLGFALIFRKQSAHRWFYLGGGVLLLVLPHLIGAPQISGPEFINADPDVVKALMGLHHQFIIAVSIVNFIFWLSMGLLCAWVFDRWVITTQVSSETQAVLR